MNRPNRGNPADARLLTPEQAQVYTGMGRTTCRKFCDQIGATVKFGTMVRFDKKIIDKELDKLTVGE